jgi:hypothetical protein
MVLAPGSTFSLVTGGTVLASSLVPSSSAVPSSSTSPPTVVLPHPFDPLGHSGVIAEAARSLERATHDEPFSFAPIFSESAVAGATGAGPSPASGYEPPALRESGEETVVGRRR